VAVSWAGSPVSLGLAFPANRGGARVALPVLRLCLPWRGTRATWRGTRAHVAWRSQPHGLRVRGAGTQGRHRCKSCQPCAAGWAPLRRQGAAAKGLQRGWNRGCVPVRESLAQLAAAAAELFSPGDVERLSMYALRRLQDAWNGGGRSLLEVDRATRPTRVEPGIRMASSPVGDAITKPAQFGRDGLPISHLADARPDTLRYDHGNRCDRPG